MSLSRAQPYKITPRGLTDSLDGSNVFQGSMQSLSNLVPDPSTSSVFCARPAATKLTDFSGFPLPGQISVAMIIGTRVYGMIESGFLPGHDQPFCYDLATSSLVGVGNITFANLPVSQGSTGAWTPPTMDLIGPRIIITHPGYDGVSQYIGWIDVTNPALPGYDAGNATGAIVFTRPPVAVKNFNGRAYYLVNNPGAPGAYFSDQLVPLHFTNANQVLTFGDNHDLTALGALSLNTQLIGGVTQALIVFKGVQGMFQITGDAALTNLAVNALNVATGTLAPNTICGTPKGLMFMSPEGMRLIDFTATVSDPIGFAGQGVTVPMIYCTTPSRAMAAASGTLVRISLQNNYVASAPNQEYWFDIARQIWTGPHTFPAAWIGSYSSTFIMAPVGVLGSLWQSDPVPTNTSTYVENGNQMSFTWRTTLLPDNNVMAENDVIETAVMAAYDAGGVYSVQAIDENDGLITSSTLSAPTGASVWGGFTWGSAPWGGTVTKLASRQVDWPIPVVFKQMSISLSGNCGQALKIGNLALRYEPLGFLQSSPGLWNNGPAPGTGTFLIGTDGAFLQGADGADLLGV